MLTVAKLSRWSVNYYNDTARAAGQAAKDAQTAGGGLAEYYSERDSRTPVWVCAGDAAAAAEMVGLADGERAGGDADPEVVARWLDDGCAPSGECGRSHGKRGVHGFDLTFCAPKSVSLVRAFGDDVTQKAVGAAHQVAITEALEYLADHAGYSRVHNPITGEKDLVSLPGVVAAAYQHETSRAGDPHLHTHVLVPNRQARSDGKLVSLDGTSLIHEARAAGMIYQATLRRELHLSVGIEWAPVDPSTGMADVAGITPTMIRAWSTRSTQLREWAANNLTVVDSAKGLTQGQLAAAQKATRPAKPEHLAWAELRQQWADDGRGFVIDEAAHQAARAARIATEKRGVNPLRLARAAAAGIDKPAFTRADLVEAIAPVLPVHIEGAPGTPRTLVEAIVDRVGMRITAQRTAAQREGSERFTAPEIISEEAAVIGLIDTRNDRAALPETTVTAAVQAAELSADQGRAITAIGTSPWLIQPLSAPAGAGKTTSLTALRSAANTDGRRVLVLAPTGQAVDVAVREGAGDAGFTVAKALRSLREGTLALDPSVLIVVDEAGMVGTTDLHELLSATTGAGVKTVLVGDAHQLAPVKARGGMFAQLCSDVPWAQRLSEVWRMTDAAERQSSLAVRDGGPAPLRRAVGWYRRQNRLHTGDPVAMAADALDAWRADQRAGRDGLLIADTWEMADALNTRIHGDTINPDAPHVVAARGHQIAVGDVIITRRNDPTISVYDATEYTKVDGAPVRNGNRWQVFEVDPDNDRIAARRISDGARAAFSGDYLTEHVTHGYAVTVHAAQGATADTTHAVLGEGANRAAAYVAMTRGRASNSVYLYDRIAGEGDHEHAEPTVGVHQARRGTSAQAAALLRTVLGRDDRARTVLQTAADTDRALLPESVQELLDTHDRTVAACRTAYRRHLGNEAVEREVAAELPALRAAVELLETAATGRSGAGGYPYSAAAKAFAEIGEPHRKAVAAIAGDLHAVQVLTIHPDAADDKPAALAAITAAARAHQKRMPFSHNQARPGVLALPATQAAADRAAELGYADTIRRPGSAVKHFQDGSWTLPPGGSLVIVDDADHLHPTLLASLVELAATRTNTKLLLITTEGTDRSADRTNEGVEVLREALPWAQHIGTPTRNSQRDNVIDRTRRDLAAAGAGVEGPATVVAAELLARHTDQARTFSDEVTARERFITSMTRSRDRDRGLDRDDGLEL
ncbi:MobF family relaxase [Mycobacteroides abscessus]|uniref:MobF family relaxase n=1 Tax=Mycobacteroides abscessus TaxID=36809 RepID=UPI0019D25424|nr:MobF family relaxase [Mycobacteroides abscessus]QSM61155.1 relaxase domain-containing protein [Mycobacteroides abscessus subsp. abscessus]